MSLPKVFGNQFLSRISAVGAPVGGGVNPDSNAGLSQSGQQMVDELIGF